MCGGMPLGPSTVAEKIEHNIEQVRADVYGSQPKPRRVHRCLRARRIIAESNIADDGTEGFDIAWVLLTAILKGTQEPERLAAFTGVDVSRIAVWAKRMRDNGLWIDGKFAFESVESKDKLYGTVEFALHTLVAGGEVVRVRDEKS